MSIYNTLIKSANADTINTGPGIGGVGNLGLEGEIINKTTVGTQFTEFLSTIVTVITVVGGLAFIIFFSLGALKWLTAGGDKNKVEEAKSQMTQGVIGLIAIVAALFVVGIIGGVLGIDILNPFATLLEGLPAETP